MKIKHYIHKQGFGITIAGKQHSIRFSDGTIYQTDGGTLRRMSSRRHEQKMELLIHNNGARRRLRK